MADSRYPGSRTTLTPLLLTLAVLALAAESAQAAIITAVARRNSTAAAPQMGLGPLDESALVYVDRTHRYRNIPAEMLGREYVMTANDDKANAEYELDVTLSQACKLYLLIDNRVGDGNGGDPPTLGAGVMDWVLTMGFAGTGMQIAVDEGGDGTIDNYAYIYARNANAGTITLYEQNDGSNRNLYAVAAGPQTGTVNNPPEVDAGDYDTLIWPINTLQLSPVVHDDDPCGLGILTYQWFKVSGPGTVTFIPGVNIADPCVAFSEPGDYTLELRVWDDLLQMGSATVTIPVIMPLLGDFNGDNKVNLLDLVIFAAQWLDPWPSPADLNARDGVNNQDFAILAANWGAGEEARVVINELLARNVQGFPDFQGQREDWIEIYNAGSEAIDIAGMYLTDDFDAPTKWRIPHGMAQFTLLAPGGFTLIFADGDVNDLGLHANFELDADNGEQLALYDTDGRTLLDKIEFGPQTADVSFGREPDGINNWVTLAPSPFASNNGRYLEVVADTKFSHDRGFYTAPFEVTITTKTAGAVIKYTTDGSAPSERIGSIYTAPVPIATTTCLRAYAFKAGCKPSNVDTQTYIFLADVARQATNPTTGAQVVPPGYPATWPGGSYSAAVTGDYQVDPDITNPAGLYGSIYAATFADDLKRVPTISLVMHKDDFFGPSGIYVNQSLDGTERVCSFEYIDPNDQDSFQINCALAMQGGVTGGGTSLSRWKTYKLSMRPRFKSLTDDLTPTGGPARMNFKIFEDSPVDSHNTIVLDAVLNHSWLHTEQGQRDTAKYIQDQYVADLHNALNGPSSNHGSHAHVYINGLYWGLYYLHERPDHAWAAEVYGGSSEEYDAIKHSTYGVIQNGLGGSAVSNLNAVITAANAVSSDPGNIAKWQTLTSMLDVDNVITYLLANWYCGNHDWPSKNWYATHRNKPGGLWRLHSWDAEHTLEGTNNTGQSPLDLHAKLAPSPEYKLRFADWIHKAFFNDGPLMAPNAGNLYQKRVNSIERAIVGESARWGDNRENYSPYKTYTRQDWLSTQNGLLTSYFPNRASTVFDSLKNAGLYPGVDAPIFLVNGSPQHGGQISSMDQFSITSTSGTIYYTLDGSDPRLPGGAANPAARSVAGGGSGVALVPEAATKKVLVPTAAISDNWRGGGSFTDTAWTTVAGAPGGVGFNRRTTGIAYEPYYSLDVDAQMYNRNASCYLRIPFTVSSANLAAIQSMTIRVRYDDGFVAYLNGTEIARRNFTGTPAWNSRASSSHSESLAVVFEDIDVSAYIGQLGSSNILAIHAMNYRTYDSDFLISVELTASIPADPGSTLLPRSAVVKARVLSGSTWSALAQAQFSVGPVAQNLKISEVMFNPGDTGDPEDPNTEYIELTNVGTQAINLNLVEFTNGVRFTFGDYVLAPGAYTLVVAKQAAFEAKYGSALPVAGEYIGRLDNAGERVTLEDAAGAVIHSFRYRDGWYAITDGLGFSLTVVDPSLADAGSLEDKASWRPSAAVGGSPGFDDSGVLPPLGAVKINEVLAHAHAEASDWIELHNTTAQAINIGGWFLSDSAANFKKYEIAAGTSIPANGYIVFYQNLHFGNAPDPGAHETFAFSENGEAAYLHSGSGGQLTGYVEEESFGASETGVAFGRYLKSTGTYNFVAMSTNTPGAANAYPKVGPVVINEIMYNPPVNGDAEYVELRNITGVPVSLQTWDDELSVYVPWRLTDDDGITYDFPLNTTIPAGGYLLVVRSLAAFSASYPGAPGGVQKLEWVNGRLDNAGEKVELSLPGDVNPNTGNRYYIRMDRVNYSDGSHPVGEDPWPTGPDGGGQSLTRISSSAYGNDVINWKGATPSPGAANP